MLTADGSASDWRSGSPGGRNASRTRLPIRRTNARLGIAMRDALRAGARSRGPLTGSRDAEASGCRRARFARSVRYRMLINACRARRHRHRAMVLAGGRHAHPHPPAPPNHRESVANAPVIEGHGCRCVALSPADRHSGLAKCFPLGFLFRHSSSPRLAGEQRKDFPCRLSR